MKICVITARGGSKRIPKKNIKNFHGKPIIAYSIEAAINSKIFDRVIISTDSDEIARVAKEYGAEVPFMRSDATSGDHATTNDVLLEVVEKLKESNTKPKFICCLYPTAPFITDDILKKSFEKLQSSGLDGAVSITKFTFPPQRAYIKNGDSVEFKHPEFALTRSQDLEEMFHDAGQFYWVKTESFISEKKLILSKMYGHELDPVLVQDIDTLDDWIIAEAKFSLLNKK